jgi:hypothetical protein
MSEMSETRQTSAKFRADALTIDADAKIDETAEYLSIEPVTLIREGVFAYEDGNALKPGDELAKGAKISRMYLAWDHPPLRVITRPSEIRGFVDGVHSEKDKDGTIKIKGRMVFDKTRLTEDQQELIRSKARRDVSLGFYYVEDRTPGTWHGKPYDYAQREYVFDHTASVDRGRCGYPACGIGVDAAHLQNQTHIGNDPYPNEHSCRMEDPGKFRASSFRRVTRGKLDMIFGKLPGESATKLQAFRYPKSKWTAAAARAHCEKAGGTFHAASSDQGDSVMKEGKDSFIWPSGEQRMQPSEVNLRAAEAEGDKCDSCIFFRRQDNTCSVVTGEVSANMVCDEFTGRGTIEEMVKSFQGNASADQLTAEERNRIPREQWGYTPSDNRSEWKLPMPNHDITVAALQVLQGARGGVDIPRADLPAVKRKVCARAKHFDIKSEYCGTADANDAVALIKRLRGMDRAALVELHMRIHKADDFSEDCLLHQALLFTLRKKR